jgi:flagellar hook-associated protein 2
MSLGLTSIDGLMSGLDTASIINALAAAQSKPITLLQDRATARTKVLNDYTSLTSQLAGLKSSAAALTDGTLLQAHSATVSDATAVLVSAGTTAAVGTYDLKIKQLAQGDKFTSDKITDTTAALGFAGDIRINGQTLTLKASDTLTDLVGAINGAQCGVSASVTTVSGTDHRLVLRSLNTGAENAISLADANGSGFLEGLGLLDGTDVSKHVITNGEASDYFSSSDKAIGTALGLSAPQSGTIKVNGTDVAVDLSQDSLQDLATRIGATVPGVTAAVTSTTTEGVTEYRLELTGASAPVLTDDQGILQTLGLVSQGAANRLQTAQDAIIEVDGSTVQRASNSIDDAVQGLSLDLLAADEDKTVTVSVNPNTKSAVDAIQRLVNSYNTVMVSINTGENYDSSTQSGGSFFGEAAILSLQQGLRDRTTSVVNTLGGNMTTMSQIGLSVDKTGQLIVDTGKLQNALASNPQGVLRLLTTQGQATGDGVEYVEATSNSSDSGAAGYAVNITQAATRATATSAQLTSGIQQDETLTISGHYKIMLQAGTTLAQARDKLNNVFKGNDMGLTASVVDDKLQIQSNFYGSTYAVNITSSLDDGVGGTDLGGATAGTAETVYGRNVAGTIGGKKATGWGQYLTGTEGGANGLKLKVTATTTGDLGVVKLSQGLSSRLTNYSAQVIDPDKGLVSRAATSISNSITEISDQVTKMKDSVNTFIEELQRQFASLEAQLVKSKTTLAYITGEYTTGSTSSSSNSSSSSS